MRDPDLALLLFCVFFFFPSFFEQEVLEEKGKMQHFCLHLASIGSN